jgi:predicted metal-dependent HD superfamily phosphohydrolase
MLKNKFKKLCHNFTDDKMLIDSLHEEIQNYHTEKHRHYHSLNHLIYLYHILEDIKLNPVYEFTIFYHDIIYDVHNKDNEEQSARLTQKRLQALTVPNEIIEEVYQLILATKKHQSSNIMHHTFLDADLGILGINLENYKNYAQNVRKEYQIYDDTNYALGRKKVLKYFLEKPNIYLTEHFQLQYEEQARSNLEWELKSLN